MDLRSVIMGVTFAFVWASAFTTTRIIVTAAPPLTALTLRFALSAALAIGLALAMGQSFRLSRAEWRAVVLFGICQNALYLGLNWVAMQWVEASAASIIASMMPLIVAFLGWAALGDRLRPMAFVGLLVGVLGVALIMGVRLQHGLSIPGTILCLLAAVALAIATLSARGASGSRNMMMIVGLQMAVGSLSLALPAALMEWGQPVAYSWTLLYAFVYTVVAPGIAATWIWFLLVNRIGAVRAATYHFLSPFFGVLVAAIVLGERFGFTDAAGALIIAAGILMVQRSKLPAQPAASSASIRRVEGSSR
ncbi:DMT family transporter [Paracoccus sp. DMF-8]|uniref:DMT family transporter n=1 Tax=Paracoccus sp. DMF-8 TaxID=3019445 RepID=UPI0023E8E80D|nr:DMT family transporter [Paracoccus sp. DMF-8]MDF3607001.1 DMT family transporter [Paracoccus sp. DMF-8]